MGLEPWSLQQLASTLTAMLPASLITIEHSHQMVIFQEQKPLAAVSDFIAGIQHSGSDVFSESLQELLLVKRRVRRSLFMVMQRDSFENTTSNYLVKRVFLLSGG